MRRKRRKYRQEVAQQDVTRFKFLDETSINTSLTRLYGRAAPGERVVERTPLPSGPATTTLAVLGWDGLTAPLVVTGAVNGAVFSGYVEHCLAPTLQPGEIVVMDNLAAHKVAGIAELIHARGAQVLYLPPYSADFNPIELAWSKVKTIVRRLKARTLPDLLEALVQALHAITQQDILHWFAHCGYAVN